MWRECLKGIKVETINAAFERYFKVGKFPPKPADIFQMAAEINESQEYPEYHKKDDWDAIQADRKAYFASDEYKQWLAKMKQKHGI